MPRRTRFVPKVTKPPKFPVTKLNPSLAKVAVEATDGDIQRIHVISEEEVVIVNGKVHKA